MKIRNGYVSNSSSSSFCIVGVKYKKEDFNKEYDDICETNNELEFQNGIYDYYDEYIIGLSICCMKDQQTLSQFKEAVFEQLKKIDFTGKKEDIDIFIDGGYEG